MKHVGTLIVGIAIGATIGVGGALLPQVFSYDAKLASQPYADEQGRPVSSLSVKDVEQLRAGQGWGLAKPAEFNGYPGPSHIIEFADSLQLSDVQLDAVKASFKSMQTQAKSLGAQLIAAEKQLDAAFVDKRISKKVLAELLGEAESVRAQLRNVHLSAHLEVTPLLSEKQKLKYAELRGYGSARHAGHGSH